MTLVARHGALSDIGLHRKTNEDTFVVRPPLYAVCDGMGGANAGEVASGLAAETLAAEVAKGTPVHAAAEAANAAVYRRAHDNVEQTGMGTTLTAFVLEGSTARFAHIGDSRAYLLRDGALRQVSDDHSLVGEMVRDGRLTEEEAAVHPHRSILSRALGTEPHARIDEFTEEVLPGDVLLLCSDGLSGPVPADAIKLALTRSDPQAAAERLILEARKQGGPDNITAVVVHIDEGPHRVQDGSEETTLVQPADPEADVATGELPFVIAAPDPEAPAGDAADALAAQAAALRAGDEGHAGAGARRRRGPPPQALGAPARRRRGAARAARRGAGGRRVLPQHPLLHRRRRRDRHHLQRRAGQGRPRAAARRLPAQLRQLRLALAVRQDPRRRAAGARPPGRARPRLHARDVQVSRRNLELVFLVLAGAVSTMAYVSVYAGRFREINRVSIIYGLVFVGIFVLLHLLERIFLPQADPFLLPITALLAAIGLTEIFRIKPSLALVQGQWLLVGAGLFVLTVLVVRDHMKLDHYRYLIGAVGLALLVVTIVLGTTINGAKLWIHAFGFSIQPSEFAKLAIVIFLAGYLDDKKVMLSVPQRHVLGVPVPAFKYFGPLLVMWVLSLAMLVFMKDFGMALLFMSIFVGLMYMATARVVYVVAGVGLFAAAGAIAVYIVPHVQDRFAIWLDPWKDSLGSGYQLLQSLFTIADGGIVGAGFGRGYLLYPDRTPVVPDLQTDFIFAAIANEMGLLGAAGVILVFLLFVWRGFRIAVYAPDGFSKLLAAGLATAFALQTFIIIGGVTRLIPLTGITLPFVSYGGSSITANLMLVALLLMVSNRTNIIRGGTDLERRKLAERG